MQSDGDKPATPLNPLAEGGCLERLVRCHGLLVKSLVTTISRPRYVTIKIGVLSGAFVDGRVY